MCFGGRKTREEREICLKIRLFGFPEIVVMGSATTAACKVVLSSVLIGLFEFERELKFWIDQSELTIVQSDASPRHVTPTNFSLQALRKNYISYFELLLKKCNNMKSVIVWSASFHLASPSFKNTGPNNSTIFNRRIEASAVFWRSSRLENYNTYFALLNMKHSRK